MPGDILSKHTKALFQAFEWVKWPMVLTDRNLHILHGNKAFRSLLDNSGFVFTAVDLPQIFPELSIALPLQACYAEYAEQDAGHIESVNMSGSEYFYDLAVSRIDGDESTLKGFIITCTDAGPRMENKVEDAELSEHHRKYLRYTDSGVIIHRHGKIIYSNDQASKLAGFRDGDSLTGKEIWAFVTEEFKNVVSERIREMVQGAHVVAPIEEKFFRIDGTTFDAQVFAFPVEFGGEPAIKTIFTDITARKNAERELRNSREQYFSLVENLTDTIFQTDTDANFIYVNNAWEHLTGFSAAETIGRSCFDFLHHPKDTQGFYNKVRKMLMFGLQEFQYDLLVDTRNGEQRYVEVRLKPVYAGSVISGINGILRDIHSKKLSDIEVRRIQKTLKEHQRILVSLTREPSIINGDLSEAMQIIARVACEALDVTRVGIWSFDNGQQSLTRNIMYCRDTGFNAAEMRFDRGDYPAYFNTLLHDGIIAADEAQHDPRFEEFYEIYIKPEHIISMMDIAIIKGQEIIGVICFENKYAYNKWTVEDQSFARSITDFITLAIDSSTLQKTKRKLFEQEGLYAGLVEQANDAILIFDAEDQILEANVAACALTGYSLEELRGIPIQQLVPPRFQHLSERISEGQRKIGRFVGERIFINKNGEERIIDLSAVTLPNDHVQCIARDITERKRQEQALKESETRLELALKGADLGIWDYNIRDNIMQHNKRWAEMLGYYFENTMVSKQFWEKFVHPEDLKISDEAFDKHVRGETPFYEATIRMLASNGEWRWILDKGKVVEWDENGVPIRASGIQQDITAIKIYQQQLLHQRKFLQEVVNAIPHLIYVKNKSDDFVTVNSALADFLGVETTELMRKNFGRPKEYEQVMHRLSARDSEVFVSGKLLFIPEEVFHNGTTEKEHWLQTIKVPLLDGEGNVSDIVSITMDVTELIAKEKELAHLNDNLELKVLERTMMLELANKELETFNYSVSHDLRTPLRTIDIFAYFLDKNYKDALDTEGLENIRQIRKSIHKMSALIDNLLVFSRIGRNSISYTAFNAEEMLGDIWKEMGEKEDLSHFTFSILPLPVINGDAGMYRDAFKHLLSNAVKFSKVRKKPEIEVFGYTDNDSISIGVKDNGVGFSQALKDKLFKAFKRLHSDEQFEGTGVGLAIVEKIIKRHGGRIWAESVEGEGSTFYFMVPQKPAQNI